MLKVVSVEIRGGGIVSLSKGSRCLRREVDKEIHVDLLTSCSGCHNEVVHVMYVKREPLRKKTYGLTML